MFKFNQKYLRYLYLNIVIFLLIFGIKYGQFFDVINIISIYYIFNSILNNHRIHRGLLIVLSILAVYTLHVNIAILYSGTIDLWHALQPYKVILNILGIACFMESLKRSGFTFIDVIFSIITAVAVHSFIVIYSVINTDFRMLIYSVTGFVEKSYLRSAGLTHSYGITSIVHAIGGILLLKYWTSLRSSKLYLYLIFIMIFASLFLLARVGLYIFVIYLFIWTAMRFSAYGFMFLIAIASLIFYIDITSLKLQNDTLENLRLSILHSLEIFYVITGVDSSFDSLAEVTKYSHHNVTTLEYLLGTGLYGRGNDHTYLATDISYLHFLSMVGLVGIITPVACYLVIFLQGRKYDYSSIFIVLIIIIANYKEATLFTRSLLSIYLLYFLTLNRFIKNDNGHNNSM